MDKSKLFQNQTIDMVRAIPTSPSAEECANLRESLGRPIPEIPPRYFYDDVGSELFERITGLSVYYQTRTEISILERCAQAIIDKIQPHHIVELGSGAGRKIRLLFDAWGESRSSDSTRYIRDATIAVSWVTSSRILRRLGRRVSDLSSSSPALSATSTRINGDFF